MLDKSVCNRTPLDMEVRYDCYECNDRKQHLYVVRRATGWSGYCHKCGFAAFRKCSVRDHLVNVTRSEVLEHNERSRSNDISDGEFEDDFQIPGSNRISREGLDWLYRYITDNDILTFRIKWDDGIIFPIYEGEKPIGYQKRLFRKGPKYITTKRYKHRPLIFSVTGRNRTIESGGEAKPHINGVGGVIADNSIGNNNANLYIVEDILSAIRLSSFLCPRSTIYAILGSPKRLNAAQMDYIKGWKESQGGKGQVNVWVWYDFDKRGDALKVSKQISQLLNVKALPVWTEKDPKALSDGEISSMVKIYR